MSLLKSICRKLSLHPSIWARNICAHSGFVGISLWHKYVYYTLRGKWPNFKHPKDLSEHILAAMSKKSFSKYADCADKVKVRDYIISKGLGHLLLNIYGSWSDANDINFDDLPDKFALKPNNGSGGHFFCKDKSKIDQEKVKKQMNEALNMVNTDIAFKFEPHYACIDPRVYCEELMDTENGINPTDYKFTCVNGQICDIFIAQEDVNRKRKYATIDTNWEILPYTKKEFLLDPIPAKPKHLDEMIKIANILSADFEWVRVDLYEYKNKVYFSELTFSPWGGYMYSYNDLGINEIGKKFDK